METFDLKLCQSCAQDVFRQRFGSVPNFKKLESIFSGLKGTDKSLSYKKIKKLSSRKYWNFDDFWMIPSWRQYKKYSSKTKGLFKELPGKEQHVIAVLYNIFKNIEVVSIILRFIDPENYGIISPPVRCALLMKAKDNYVDEYLDYLENLRLYAIEYAFSRAADVDVALWALVEKCLRAKDVDCQNFKKYQEKLLTIEDEIMKKSELFRMLEEEILKAAREEAAKNEAELERLKKELKELQRVFKKIPENLINLEKSPLVPEKKIIHDIRELPLDASQKYFMKKLSQIPFIHKIIWSENTTAKYPSRISGVKNGGELTLLYVTKDNYAAKIKVYPVRCPDQTHARYFASKVAKAMNIKLFE